MDRHAVVIAGGGPTGLMLAGELALAGVNVAIVEPRADQEVVGMRARGVNARTVEVFDQRGIADRFLAQGKPHKATYFHVPLDVTDCPTRHNYTLGLAQKHIERILAGWVEELKVPIYRERAVTGFTQDENRVDVALSDGEMIRADYLVGCDGGRSLVRKTAGIKFPGWDATVSWLIAEAELAVQPPWGFRHDALGTHAIGREEGAPPGRAGMVLVEKNLGPNTQPGLQDVRDALLAVYGTDFGIHSPTWISRFSDMTRQAENYRVGRVLVAGDAAHIHPPVGGQGLNLGVQDAVNLGWKLALVVNQKAPEVLLDSYQAERHPVAARVLRLTMAQTALRRPDARTKAVGETVAELLSMEEPRQRMAAEMAGLSIRYDLGDGHPLIGRRMPDLDLLTAYGGQTVFSFLHQARPVLFDLNAPKRFDIARWRSLVTPIEAKYSGRWDLPGIGIVPAPAAVLVRPDGYVAWVAEQGENRLAEILNGWLQ